MKPITHVSLHTGPEDDESEFLVGIRVVPAGRKGNIVYGRTLNHGEPDSGEGIQLKPGETFQIPPGGLRVTIADVDRYAEAGDDGYAPVANTVWTWLQIPPHDHKSEEFVRYILAAARRLDMAHSQCNSVLRFLDDPTDEKGFPAREAFFDAYGHAELMCVALGRAVRMITGARKNISARAAVPLEVDKIEEAISAIRNAFEHIDERAVGKARGESPADAISVFRQSDFPSGVLRYANYSIDLRAEVLPALIAGRQFIVDAATKAGLEKTATG